ncbi:hypothetical protein F5883DRAFT_122468 [Diaporthe sp. PMI_573]|nr:hypothetical protein F5883DRAFT_122468 [Diaporthaceae sp. PMI_573]
MIFTILVNLFQGDWLELAFEETVEPLPTLCGRGDYETELEALNDCRDRSQRNDFGLSVLRYEETDKSSRCNNQKKIFSNRLAGRHDTWRHQQWERASQWNMLFSRRDWWQESVQVRRVEHLLLRMATSGRHQQSVGQFPKQIEYNSSPKFLGVLRVAQVTAVWAQGRGKGRRMGIRKFGLHLSDSCWIRIARLKVRDCSSEDIMIR